MKANKLIHEATKELKEIMKNNLESSAIDFVARIMREYKKLTPAQKAKAIKGKKIAGLQYYKAVLKEALAVIARESILIAKKEVPSKIQFAEFEKLPKKIRDRIELTATLLIGAQVADLEKTIFFTYSDMLTKSDSEMLIQNALGDSVTAYLAGPSLSGAASMTAGKTVNEARQAYFYEDEVIQEIEAFVYRNNVAVSAICKELKDHVFKKGDPEMRRYQPPLHWNCDGYFEPILVGNLKGREPSRFKPSKKAQDNIQFGEGCDCQNEQNVSYLTADMSIPPEISSIARNAISNIDKVSKIPADAYTMAITLSEQSEITLPCLARIASFKAVLDQIKLTENNSSNLEFYGGVLGINWAYNKLQKINTDIL